MPLTNDQIESNFKDLHPPLAQAEAMLEANRCLFCYDAPCTRACPTHIDVPKFIKKIASGNLDGAAKAIFDANPIGGSCARVCPVEVLCEGACVEKTLVKKPIEIGRLQRYATDHAIGNGRPLFEKSAPNGKSVAVIGSGPAGLSCASYLARLGYDVTVYEKRDKAGGLDTYGMAEYKMPQKTSLDEVKLVESFGVNFALNSNVGRNEFDELRSKHDAVFLGIGLGKTNRLGIPGEDSVGVIDALHFIEQIKTRNWETIEVGRNVAVIGAGNTAIDAVTQAKRLGAERAMLVYRRRESDAPAYAYEIELAKSDAIEFFWESTPVEIIGDTHVTGLKFRKSDGREMTIECDQVIKAIGQTKQAVFFSELGIDTDEKGRVKVDSSLRTSDPKVFAGGDCVNGGAEAVNAAQHGKIAAAGIHEFLTGSRPALAGAY